MIGCESLRNACLITPRVSPRLPTYLDVAGLFHEATGILSGTVALGQLHPEELQRTLKISLQQVLLGGLREERYRQRHITSQST